MKKSAQFVEFKSLRRGWTKFYEVLARPVSMRADSLIESVLCLSFWVEKVRRFTRVKAELWIRWGSPLFPVWRCPVGDGNARQIEF